MPEGGFFSFAETVPDRNREALAQAGPMISYKRPEERIIVESSVPVSPGSRRWPKAARPMETPAWGIRARPRKFRAFLTVLVMRQPA